MAVERLSDLEVRVTTPLTEDDVRQLKIGDHVVISGNPARNAKQHQVRMLSLHRTKDGFGWGKKPGEVVD